MKRILVVLFSLCFVLVTIGCSKKEVEFTIPVTIEGSIFSGSNENPVKLDLTFDYDWITKDKNTKYNKDLAAFASLIATDTYFREKDVAKNTQNRVLIDEASDEYDNTLLLKKLGFSDVEHIESYKMKEYATDSNDSVTMNMGYCLKDDKYDVFVVAIRGCFSAGEWEGIFDGGVNNDNYYQEHPEWLNHNNQKSLDISSNRAKEFVDEFIDEHDNPDKENCILITGHSKGGCIANILGTYYEEDKSIKSYTYTFETLAITLDSKAKDYKTIFNILNENDLYTNLLAYKNEKMVRYGIDKVIDIANSKDIVNQIEKLNSNEKYIGVNKEVIDEYHKIFAQIFTDRNSVNEERKIEKKFNDKSMAEETLETYNSLLDSSNLNLSDFVEFSEISQNNDEYVFEMTYQKNAILRSLSKVIAYGSNAYNAIIDIFKEDQEVITLMDLVYNNLNKTNMGHLIVNDYILSLNLK